MKSVTRNACLPVCLLLSGVAWLGLDSPVAFGQEGVTEAQHVVHNAPESITGTLEGNKADLFSAWRFLTHLAVRLFSGNQAELLSGNAPELLSNNSTALLSGNAPELLSGNTTSLLSGNEPELFSGNKVVLFSHNTLQIYLTESSNKTPSHDALSRNLSAPRARGGSQGEQAQRQEASVQAQVKAAQSRAKAAIERERTQTENLADELSQLRAKVQELAAQNKALKARIADIETDRQ